MSTANHESLQEYSEKLRGLIEDPSIGVLLRARSLGDPHYAFELPSGALVTEYVTLWELFDHREHFRELVQMFALKAREIRGRTPFTAVVTATATAKHIMEHVHAAIETDRDKVSIFYLGNYPFLDFENRKLLDFKGEDVLVVTDVIGSGTLVTKIAEIVEAVGGRPIGILCVALTGEELIANPVLRLNRSYNIRIYPLTTWEIPRLESPREGKKPRVIKIDPVTLLPEEDFLLPKDAVNPCFSEAEMFAHFESAQAIDFNFHQMDHRRFMTAVRVHLLLARHDDAIWRQIKDRIEAGETLVTTFDRDDVVFKEFVEDQLDVSSRSTFVFVPKRDSPESPNSYFLLPASGKEISGRKVVLLLASIYTSERLGNLASLLVTQGAKSITVVCLLNRMGPDTSSFVSRIECMLRGSGDEGPYADRHAAFSFVSLYSLPEINSDALYRMQDTIHALFGRYDEQTRVPSFRRWIRQDLKYFRPQSLTSSEFERPTFHPLAEPFRLKGEGKYSIQVSSWEGKLTLLCSRLVANRDYRQLIREIHQRPDKETLYKIFGILLSDLSYLKMARHFPELRSTLIEELRALRNERFASEPPDLPNDSPPPNEPQVDTETHLLVGLALFSYLDHEFDYQPILREVLTCGRDIEAWTASPSNFFYYFAEERTAWCLSMLLHFSQHNFRQPSVAKELKNDLETQTLLYLKNLDEILPDPRFSPTERQRVKANLNILLTDLGVYDLKEKHHLIRFLHSKIIAVKRGHNPIDSSLESALIELQKVLANNAGAENLESGRHRRRIPIRALATKKALEDAIYTTGILEEIAEAIRQMLAFTPVARDSVARYSNSNEPDLPGFSHDVRRLGDLFQEIRLINLVSEGDVEEITKLRTALSADLWGSDSFIRKLLQLYIVPLREVTDSALTTANIALRDRFGDLWEPSRHKIQNWSEEAFVLIDRPLLREVLRNIFTNVRHSLEYLDVPGGTYADLVDIDLIAITRPVPDLKTEVRDYWRLTVRSRGRNFPGFQGGRYFGTTFGHQQREVAEFAGELRIDPLEEETGSVVTLTLLARHLPPEGYSDTDEML